MKNAGLDEKTYENLKKIQEKMSGYSIPQIDFSKMEKRLTELKKLVPCDLMTLQERLITNSNLFLMTDKFREYVKVVRETEGITEEEFEQKFSKEIERSRKLGRNGWIPSEHGKPKHIAEWSEYILDSPEKIMEFFEKDDEKVIKKIKNILSRVYIQKPYITYYQNGIKAFDNKEYMTAALYLTILFEIRISNLVEFPKKNAKNQRLRYQDKYSSYGYSIQKNKDYENATGFIEKRFYILNFYPALEEYTNRLFCFGNLPLDMEQESEPEPDYLDRTWLLHGRCCRETTRVDCVQLLNALDVCEFIFSKFKDSLSEDISDKTVINTET
ncbi:hypothetical protein DW721_04680 [Clostridium sp. AM27-31LB]|uniref:hypothetical protein n=1 Tax=Clostridium sp. AM27-31LB TaxID=2293026 RepID=UPI000E4DA98A|nr:hypothetical protein [Clostridium sp. AM27-31LB]RHT95059.1 hypothetical protein DW721_04680 [Clostridium sp. AM27-31LB]